MLTLKDVIVCINSCEELDLPNGAKGAIWKEDLINKIKSLNTEVSQHNINLLKTNNNGTNTASTRST